MQAEQYLKSLSEMTVSLLYPRRCPVCDDIVKRGDGLIHPKCREKIRYAGDNTCMKCGKPLQDEKEEYCPDCMRIRHDYDRGFAVFRYRQISGSIYRFKYSGRREYAAFYAEEAFKTLGSTIKNLGADAIIPVPMYAGKERKRGYNQAAVFAKELEKVTGIPVYPHAASRVRDTVPMKMLDSSERRSNLKKAFNITQNDVKFKCIILVDDIYTTGSTIDELSREFRGVGVNRIFFVTLAIGQVV